ncbi:CUB and sushi domain-containing protein 1-like [Urocitellus parryii]
MSRSCCLWRWVTGFPRSLLSFLTTSLQLPLSGFQLPSSIVSSGSVLTLWFTTDFAVSAQGFKALYEGHLIPAQPQS